MTSIGGIGWSPRLGSEKSHDVHGWIVVYQKLAVLGAGGSIPVVLIWRRLQAGVCVCVLQIPVQAFIWGRTPKPKFSLFFVLFQNHQHCFEKWYMHPEINCPKKSNIALKFQ